MRFLDPFDFAQGKTFARNDKRGNGEEAWSEALPRRELASLHL
jgi:hypothetical protein